MKFLSETIGSLIVGMKMAERKPYFNQKMPVALDYGH
jgi:hypothetical protein